MNARILERAAIIKLHKDGLTNGEILKRLKIGRNSRNKVKRTIERYTETGSLENRIHKNHPRSVRTPKMLKALRERIRRNPCRKQETLAIEMGTSVRTIRRAIKEDLGFKALNRHY